MYGDSQPPRLMSARTAVLLLLAGFLLLAIGYGYVLYALNLLHP